MNLCQRVACGSIETTLGGRVHDFSSSLLLKHETVVRETFENCFLPSNKRENDFPLLTLETWLILFCSKSF